MPESTNTVRSAKSQVESLLDAAREISAARNQILAELRESLQQGNDVLSLSLARRLVGLYDEPTQKPS